MCGSFGASSARHLAGQQAEPRRALVLDRALEQQLHAEADAEHGRAALRPLADDLVEAGGAQAAHRLGERAHAGDDDASAARISSGSAVRATVAPTCSSAFSTERRLPIP